MSGIAGIIRFDGAPVEPGLIEKMTRSMDHRGPDGINHWSKGSVALGHGMLRTTPESLEEHQPLTNEDETIVLVMDGRVDNWEDLRRELRGRSTLLRTRSDAELVLKAYEVWGRDCLAHIEGDFAMVIWDARRQEAFCARDRMAHKPFYFWRSGQSLAFGSELSAIMVLPWVNAQTNLGMVAEFVTQEFFSTSETLWAEIEKLPAAMCMRVGKESLSRQRYWSPESVKEIAYVNDDEYIEHYRQLLIEQLRRSARSFRPIAVEVSGGLDSSAVYSGCTHLYREGALTAPDIAGYTFDMSEEPNFDDTKYVAAVETFLDAEICHVKPFIDSPDGYLARASKTMNFPGYPNGVVHLSIYGQARHSGCCALLTGVGGDEWLGGARTYFSEELLSGRFAILSDLFRQEVQATGFLEALRVALGDIARSMLPSSVRTIVRQARRKHSLTQQETSLRLSDALASLHATRKVHAHPSTKASDCDRRDKQRMQEYYLHPFRTLAAEQSELLGALSGLETRHPLDSSAMLGFSMACPVRLRRRNVLDRYMHRKAMVGLLPPAVLERTSKAYFDFVFRRSLESLSRENFPPAVLREWVNIEPDDLSRQWQNAGSENALCWKDWSAWSLFACGTLHETMAASWPKKAVQ